MREYDGKDEEGFDVNVKCGEIVGVVGLGNMVLFGGVLVGMRVGGKCCVKVVGDGEKKDKDIGVVWERWGDREDGKVEDLENMGRVGGIVGILEMGDERRRVIVEGMKGLSVSRMMESDG